MDKLPDAAKLVQRLDAFHIIVDNADTVTNLLAAPAPTAWLDGRAGTAAAARAAKGRTWSVFVMVDCGYHRDGVDPTDPASVELARMLADSPTTTLAGCYTHGGHSYSSASAAAVQEVAAIERDAVVNFAAAGGCVLLT
jgi:D-serine deaminase-like pyridoxal phosphate-dependent protein